MTALSSIPRTDLWALALLPLLVLGIHWMRSPVTAARGNAIGALGLLGLVLLTIHGVGLWAQPAMWAWLAAGAAGGLVMATRVKMIQMPELVALFNGIGGAASAIVALLILLGPPGDPVTRVAAFIAVAIGAVTFSGSAVAVLKLARVLGPRPIVVRGHGAWNLGLTAALALLATAGGALQGGHAATAAWLTLALGLAAGLMVLLRVGGADMPVSISFLNALSGVAAAVAGYAVHNPALVAVGALVGAGGLMLTGVMCRAMNRTLRDVLAGRLKTVPGAVAASAPSDVEVHEAASSVAQDPVALLLAAQRVIIIPGYGMALAQAQPAVKRLFDALLRRGIDVQFGIHAVAGRMPGHMHILLAEVDIPYDRFKEMDEVNPLLPEADVALIVGANDVVNPAANTIADTPISGMPVLDAGAARAVLICNLDRQPGYAGVANPLYDRPNAVFCPGNAAETVARLAATLESEEKTTR